MKYLDRTRLEGIAVDLLSRRPDAAEDVLRGEEIRHSHGSGAGESSGHQESTPGWCVCGNCRPMLTQRENLCCGRELSCLSRTENFRLLCTNANVLEITMRDKNDVFQTPPNRANEEVR